ncbi:hypothetical protein [Mycobacteroides abscessus]|uniref:hypothetical protein n=1 Tax=Mycobacteroides abscessus TaxID=36809 RepID=UPI001F4181C8|nr:hypothetical protein [Mycobacteroides abscessus]
MSLLAFARKMERAERRRQAEVRERIQAERVAREVERLRKVAELEASGKAAKLSGVDREAEQLFELVCDRPGITRTQALGVVPSEAGWDDLVACSDIELVATGAESEPGAFSAVRLIHARDSIMKTLRAARGAWVSVRELRDATPYSNGYRAAAIKTLGLIEHDGRNRYRRIMECVSGRHNYEHLGTSCDEMDAKVAEAKRIAGMKGLVLMTSEGSETNRDHGAGMYKSGFSHDGSGEVHVIED